MQVDPMHEDEWTERLLRGRENELDNLARVIERSQRRDERPFVRKVPCSREVHWNPFVGGRGRKVLDGVVEPMSCGRFDVGARWRVEHPDAPDGIAIIGYDDERATYLQHCAERGTAALRATRSSSPPAAVVRPRRRVMPASARRRRTHRDPRGSRGCSLPSSFALSLFLGLGVFVRTGLRLLSCSETHRPRVWAMRPSGLQRGGDLRSSASAGVSTPIARSPAPAA